MTLDEAREVAKKLPPGTYPISEEKWDLLEKDVIIHINDIKPNEFAKFRGEHLWELRIDQVRFKKSEEVK